MVLRIAAIGCAMLPTLANTRFVLRTQHIRRRIPKPRAAIHPEHIAIRAGEQRIELHVCAIHAGILMNPRGDHCKIVAERNGGDSIEDTGFRLRRLSRHNSYECHCEEKLRSVAEQFRRSNPLRFDEPQGIASSNQPPFGRLILLAMTV